MLHELTASEQADRVRSGELSAVELLDHYLARIAAGNEALNAIYFLDADAARARAAEVDAAVARGEDPGPFAGVPVGIKELEDVAGWPSEEGSLLFAGKTAKADGHQTARIRRAGAVLVGKTTSPEFGSVAFTRTKLHGTTRNPWDTSRTPGGSSGGSAAAVAAGLLPIASASDGGGSTRIPSSYSGLFGLKPTFGRIASGPGVPSVTQTGVLGCVARSVRDSARWLDAVCGPAGSDFLSLPAPGFSYEDRLAEGPPRRPDGSPLRAAWSPDLGYAVVDPVVAAQTEAAAHALAEAAGLRMVEREVRLRDTGPAWGVMNAIDTVRELGGFHPERLGDMTPVVRLGLEYAMTADVTQLGRAMEARYELVTAVGAIFDDVDVLLTPATPDVAFDAEGPMPIEVAGQKCRPTNSAAFTIPFNMAGNAACSVPSGVTPTGLPVGLQIVGRRFDEDVVLGLAAVLEQAQPWQRLAPGV